MAPDDPTIDELPTVLERPGPRDRRASQPEEPERPATDRRTTALTADLGVTTLATMRAEEVENTRVIIRIGRLLGIAALIPTPFLGGSVTLRVIFAVLVALAVIAGVVVDRRLSRDPSRYTEAMMLSLAVVAGLAAAVGLLYWGIWSAAQLFPALALYFYARRVALGPALGVYLGCVVLQGVSAGLVIAGAVDDPGLFSAALDPETLLVGHLLIQLGDLSAFLLGRLSHRASRAAIERMHRVSRVAAQREALLHEVRLDLDRVLRVGGPGRYTDQTFGDYRLGAVIGHGGMGEVYEAEHVETGEAAAVKLLPVRELADEHHMARFAREMAIVSSLRSPHVVRVLETSEPDDPIPYLVMERLRGDDLAQLLRRDDLSTAGLDKMLREIGAALDAAREAGIVHRDLKPRNVLLADSDGGSIWKVLDFGVATLSESSGTLTAGDVVGTPLYMSPEQACGEPVDHRADLYALGALVYRWLTGRPPFAGREGKGLLYQVVNAMPARPSAFADLPEAVDLVLAIAMAKYPADRFDDAEKLREAIAAALAGEIDADLERRARSLLATRPWS
jgi:serine/threonine-protein kinase